MHVPEEDLVLHYYGELAGSDEPRVAAHLQHCRDCHDAYRRLQQVLLSVTEASVSPPELPDGFERVVWARLEPGLASEPRSWWARILPAPSRLIWGAAVAMLVVGAFLAGRIAPGPPQPAVVAGDQVRERILLVDLGDHLDRSQRVLVELVSADREYADDFSGERERAEELVSANRLYRQTAAATGDASVVELLDQLERVLVEVAAASSGRLSTRELEDVQMRIQSGSLLFKVRVVSSDLEERRKAAMRRAGQGSSL